MFFLVQKSLVFRARSRSPQPGVKVSQGSSALELLYEMPGEVPKFHDASHGETFGFNRNLTMNNGELKHQNYER
jgi:hypothetical protein